MFLALLYIVYLLCLWLDVACDKQTFRRSFKSTMICPVFQTSSVRASQPSHRNSPVQTLAPFGQTPLQHRVAECTEPHSELHTQHKLLYKHMVTCKKS